MTISTKLSRVSIFLTQTVLNDKKCGSYQCSVTEDPFFS